MKKHSSRYRHAFLRSPLFNFALALLVIVPLAASVRPMDARASFADESFQRIWSRTDAPVAAGQTQRSWYWGPQPGNTHNEPFKAGTRLVQYFDKARMEINNPKGDRSSEWFVTTGLLVAEMVAGKQQVSDREFVPKQAAEIAVGGEGLATDPEAPTYTSFRPVASITVPGANRAPKRTGQAATATIDRAGRVGDNPALGLYPGAKFAAYNEQLGHNIPQAMWDFLNLKGVVQRNGANVQGQTLANWVYVMGYPITEPYWARIKIDGIYQDVLFQLYERRSLSYIPAMTSGWQVQMGNVGQHYYRWLYGGPLPAPLVPLGGQGAAPPVPDPVDATVNPKVAAVGTPIGITISGFRAGEEIVSWFTAPDGTASDARLNPVAGPDGKVGNLSIPTLGMALGQWAMTFHGTGSNHESIAYFYLTEKAPTPTPTRQPQGSATPQGSPQATATRPTPPIPGGTPNPSATVPAVPTEPPSGLLISVRPGVGAAGDQFTFSGRGLLPGEGVQVQFTDPTGAVVYPANSDNGRYTAGADGRLEFTLRPDQSFPAAPPGVWLFELRGLQSGLEGVVGFVIR